MGEAEIADFIAITGASRGVALRMLDAAGGDLQEATDKFFADGGATAAAPEKPAARKPSGGKSGSQSKQGISGFAQLNQEEDSDDDDHNEYYVGGEKSGQLVKGAPKNEGRSADDAIKGLFDNARASGAREGRPEDLHPASRGGPGAGGFHAFGGRARTLAGGDVAPPESQEEGEEEEEDTAKELTVTIAFYANGIFTVNDGEPRRIDDPANLQFMDAISRGQCPPELDPGDPDVHIAVNLVRRGEDYTPPAQPRFTAFGGSGRKLTDDTAAAGPSKSKPVPTSVASGGVPWEGADPEKPKTSIQLRLADGSRQVAEFNLDQTVGHIRKFIHAARPDMPLTFSLATAFPQAALSDDSATIESAGLANSVVIQKMN